jgi:hypothetical protein
LGIVYLNIKKRHISKKDAKDFLSDATTRGYRIADRLVDEMFAAL